MLKLFARVEVIVNFKIRAATMSFLFECRDICLFIRCKTESSLAMLAVLSAIAWPDVLGEG